MRLWHTLFGHPIEHVVADIHYPVDGGINTKLSCRCGWSIGPTPNFVERK